MASSPSLPNPELPNPELMNLLLSAIAGLSWMSEADYPFSVVTWKDETQTSLTPQRLLLLTQHGATTPVTVEDFDQFFAPALQEQDWYGEEEKAIVQKYHHLVDLLKQHLKQPTVYRVGETEVDIYILGETKTQGGIAGVATRAVET